MTSQEQLEAADRAHRAERERKLIRALQEHDGLSYEQLEIMERALATSEDDPLRGREVHFCDEYNDSCNCHPEYRTSEGSAGGPHQAGFEWGRIVVGRRLNSTALPDNLAWREELTTAEMAQFREGARQGIERQTLQETHAKHKKDLNDQIQALTRELKALTARLAAVREDLLPAAIARREADIAAKRAQLDRLTTEAAQ